jgi:hypothetical protein
VDANESRKRTNLCDRTNDSITRNEVEKIGDVRGEAAGPGFGLLLAPLDDQPQQLVTRCGVFSHLPHPEQQSLLQHLPVHSWAQQASGAEVAPVSLALD